jgi:hypothetical protein
MNGKYWVILGVIQLTGIAAAFVAMRVFQDPILLLLSLALLLPGSLVWAEMTWGRFGLNLGYLSLGAISLIVNAILFASLLFLLKRFRRAR